jgi:hypothetical protein
MNTDEKNIRQTHTYLIEVHRVFMLFTDIAAKKFELLIAVDDWPQVIFYNLPHWAHLRIMPCLN